MRSAMINVTELDNFLKMVKLERELAALLKFYNESQKLQLKRLQRIEEVSRVLAAFKPQYKEWHKGLDQETKDAIKKYGRY